MAALALLIYAYINCEESQTYVHSWEGKKNTTEEEKKNKSKFPAHFPAPVKHILKPQQISLHYHHMKLHLRTKPHLRSSYTFISRKQAGCTYIDEVRDVVDVVFTDSRVGGCQVQQVVVPGFSTLQLVFRIFGLSLKKQNEMSEYK